jgi:DNA polymerase-4
MKKPDAITVITLENFKEKVWPLPVEEMLYVGRSTKEKLNHIGIYTIGDIARHEDKWLKKYLGNAWGETLKRFALGLDDSPVLCRKDEDTKSIGNSLTDYKDLYYYEQVKTLIFLLAESVAGRLRESGLGKANVVKITVTDSALKTFGKQRKIDVPTSSALVIARVAFDMFFDLYKWENPVRGIGVSVSDFTHGNEQISMDFDGSMEYARKLDALESAVDGIRKKYGNLSIRRAQVMQDKKLADTDIKGAGSHSISSGKMDNNED